MLEVLGFLWTREKPSFLGWGGGGGGDEVQNSNTSCFRDLAFLGSPETRLACGAGFAAPQLRPPGAGYAGAWRLLRPAGENTLPPTPNPPLL